MEIDRRDTAVVFTDPQNEVLSETGQAWPLVQESLAENNTIENMDRLFSAAKQLGFEVFISPHYFYPTDAGWKFNGALEADEAAGGFFGRRGILNLEGLAGSGADWLPRFQPSIADGKTVVVAPHKVFGPETNDLGVRGRGGQKRHRRDEASDVGLRLHGGAHQLRVPGACGAACRRSDRRDEARPAVAILRLPRNNTIL